MKKKTNEVPFDGERFKKAIARRGESARNIAEEMGASNAYWTSRAKYGSISQRDAVWLETVKGITPDEYAPVVTVEQSAVDPTNLRPVLRGVVKDTINERVSNDEFIKAVQAIIRPAVRDVMREERDAIIEAVTDAVKTVLE